MAITLNFEKLLVNVDTIEGTIAGMEFDLPKSDYVVLYDRHRAQKTVYGNRIKVKGKHGVHSMHYRTRNTNSLEFEGSIFGCKYGQNVYTSSDVQAACRIAIKKILKETNLEVDEDLKNRWLSGEVELSRVDLAVNFRLSSVEDVHRVLKQVQRQLVEQYGSTRSCGHTVYWSPQYGKKYEVVMYAKGDQIKSNRGRVKLRPSYWGRLGKECENILRVEVRLRAPELRLHNLVKASNWSEDRAKDIFIHYVQRLKIFNVTSGPLKEEDLELLPDRLRPVMALHKAGIDLNVVYCKRTFQRHQSRFRKMGIDLRSPNQPEMNTVMLMDYLSADKQINVIPAWMIKRGLASSGESKMKPGQNALATKSSSKKVFTRCV